MTTKNKIIDLRSDTVTRPSDAMRKAMAYAEVGDDVYGEDPTINRLEGLAADLLGTEAAIFTPSGTQSNLVALLSHCGRGDEYIVGQNAHSYKYEGGGAAVLGGIQPQPLEFEPDGTLDLDKVRSVIKPDDNHFAKTKLLCLENTHGGIALPMDYLSEAESFSRTHKLCFHLDGARIFNAAVKNNVSVSDISSRFDSISFCLSKGLGAPTGSLMCSTSGLVKQARRWRKVLGGGMRQAGIIAAAGIYALENNIERLAEDHDNAGALAAGLSGIDELTVIYEQAQTNMVYLECNEETSRELGKYLTEKGILIRPAPTIRLVVHLDVNRNDIEKVVESFKSFFKKQVL